ncbi:MAG TPA: efflux RND transporter periplasmic adaptor subunit [Mesorhizobium sp.]
MAAWKQIFFALVVVVAAAAAWVRFFPGAPAVLDRWGIEWAHASIATPGEATAAKAGGAKSSIPVVTALVSTATINGRLQAIGSGRAKATVTVNPYAAGRLTEFLVQSGSHVEKGQTVARLDSDTETIAVDRAKVGVQDAQSKLDRVKRLQATRTASLVAVSDAEVTLDNARLQLREAELALERRSIVAPIGGTVGILPMEAGNYVTSQSAVATIDDRTAILVDFWVPERFAASIKVGAPITATPIASPKDVFQGSVAAVDNRVDEKSRTLWVQALIENPADSLRAGMAFDVTMKFPGDSYPAVSPLAIQWGTDGAYVWAVEDGKTKRVAVRIIQRNTETVLIDAPVVSGDIVVTQGVQSVTEGGEVRIAGEDQRAADASGS